MSKLANLRIGTRLGAGFGVLLVLILVVAGLGQYAQRTVGEATDQMMSGDMVKHENLLQIMLNSQEGANSMLKMFQAQDPAEVKRIIDARAGSTTVSNDRYKLLAELTVGEEGKALLADLVASRKAYTPMRTKTIELLAAGKRDEALKLWDTQGEATLVAYRKQLERDLEYLKKRVAQRTELIARTNRSSTVLILSATVLALLLGGLLAFFTTRSITRPLGTAVTVAESVAAGDLSQPIPAASRDEVGVLLQALARMQQQLQLVIAAQNAMADQHDAGAISYRIDVAALPGAYGQLAERINSLVAAHIAANQRVIEVVKHYAVGDLSVDMEELPGEQAQITATIREVKHSLHSINAEFAALVEAAVRGDFTVRGDAQKYQHEFRMMVEGMNRLMQLSDTGLSEVSRVLAALSRGDLTERITNQYAGTFGRLKDDSNLTAEKLSAIVGEIRESTGAINAASKEIAQGNSDLSSRTEEQASSLEETASSMEELTATVKQNAENARQANQLAVGASEVAVKGGQVVGEVVTTMGAINASSKKIADIISVIDGIAFQTNILALNAAVEAARAGEQGRGFAVVATEVRNLAQRSAAAAKEIKDLINDSVDKVGNGTKLVDQAGKTMEEIVTSIKRVTDIMSEITAASQEQSAGIEQVNAAITQMDEVTQQNAALVEQAAAAAESMQEQAQNLAQAVAVFRLEGGEAEPAGVPERRDVATRPANVERLPARAEQPKRASGEPQRTPGGKKTGTSDDWSEF